MDEKIAKGMADGASLVADLIRKNKKRRDELVKMLIPQLAPETKRKIIESQKPFVLEIFDDAILERYLSELITDFDANLHWLEENEISALAGIINQKPLISFCGPD